MNKRLVDDKRAVIAHDQSSEVAEPSHAALDDPAVSVTAQHATVLRRSSIPIRTVGRNQGDPTAAQPFTQRVAVIGLVGNHSRGLLSRPSAVVPPPDADRVQGFFRQPDLGRRGRVKSDSQRNAAAVDHHPPLRALAPLGFTDGVAPFWAGAILPSRNASLPCHGWRSFNSPRKARPILSPTACASPSRRRRQRVEGEGNSSGKSCQRAPLRSICANDQMMSRNS